MSVVCCAVSGMASVQHRRPQETNAKRNPAQWLATDPTRLAVQRRADPVQEVVVSHDSTAVVYGIGDMPTPAVHLTATRRIRTSAAGVKTYQAQLHLKEGRAR